MPLSAEQQRRPPYRVVGVRQGSSTRRCLRRGLDDRQGRDGAAEMRHEEQRIVAGPRIPAPFLGAGSAVPLSDSAKAVTLVVRAQRSAPVRHRNPASAPGTRATTSTPDDPARRARGWPARMRSGSAKMMSKRDAAAPASAEAVDQLRHEIARPRPLSEALQSFPRRCRRCGPEGRRDMRAAVGAGSCRTRGCAARSTIGDRSAGWHRSAAISSSAPGIRTSSQRFIGRAENANQGGKSGGPPPGRPAAIGALWPSGAWLATVARSRQASCSCRSPIPPRCRRARRS